MTDVFLLVLMTFVAWLVHGGLVSLYWKKFDSTKSTGFRVAHTGEVFLTTSVMILAFSAISSGDMSLLRAIATVLLTLTVLDGLGLVFAKTLRKQFDTIHFVSAYLAAALAITFVFSII